MKLDLIQNRLMSQKTNFENLESENENVDVTEVAVKLTSAELTYEAALMAKGIEKLGQYSVKNISLTNFDVIAKVAAETGYIKESDIERLIAFRDNPSDESWIAGGKN